MSDVRQVPDGPFAVVPLDGGVHGFRLVGELDLATTRQLQEALEQLPAEGEVVLDLSELTFIDSTGLHAIVEHARADDGPIVLANPSETVRRVLHIAGLDAHPGLRLRS
jgi:anti-anti-sigma factor